MNLTVTNLVLCLFVGQQDLPENFVPALTAVLHCVAWLCLGLRTSEPSY